MSAQQDREELMRTFARFNYECPLLCNNGNAGTLIEVLEKLRKYETALSAINVRQCNGYTEFNETYRKELETKDTTKKAHVEESVKGIADLMGFKVKFNGDPRGGAIRFILPSGASNGWDNETWGIYW